MANNVEDIGNKGEFSTWVVDPNPPNNDNIIPEDLFVWVNFRALPKSRSVIETDGTYRSDFVASKGVQFITTTTQNGGEYVTTNYTNVGGMQTGEKECFGIQKIDISYNSTLAPEVDITFFDVRGGGLFNGYENVDSKDMKYNSSELATFFELPHPMFELTVKGFYGKAVSYCLHLRDFNSSFDEGGNFIIQAKFVGYTFAFLSDILLQYVMAVTSSEIGASALEKANVISLNDFLINLGQLTRISNEFKADSDEYQELKVVNSVLTQLERLQKTIGKPVDITNTSVYGNSLPFVQLKINRDQLFIRDVGLISDESHDIHEIIVEDLEKFVKEFNKLVKDNQGSYSYLSKYKIDNFDIKTPALSRELNNETVNYIIYEILKDGVSTNTNIITLDALRTRLGLSETSNKKFYVINYFKFRKEVSDLIGEVGKKKNQLESDINESLNKTISQELGFNLTIQNIFEIILGNVEAYLDVLYSVAVAADNPNLQKERVALLNNVRTDINPESERIFPFPAAIDNTTGDEIWLGDIVGENNPVFPELRLVREVINAMVSSNSSTTKQKIANNANNNLSSVNDGWIPINPLDFANNSLADLNDLTFNGSELPQEFVDAIVKRATVAYNYTQYDEARFNNIAQMEASYCASQLVNNLHKQVLKNYDSNDFVNQVLGKTTISNDITLNTFDFSQIKGVYWQGYSQEDDNIIEDVVMQKKKVLSEEVTTTLDSFGKDIEDTLILKKEKRYHRGINPITSFIEGDVTDILWSDEVYKNIKKYHKLRTTNDLESNKTYNSIIFDVNDLTIVDGQINQTIDFGKPTDKEAKFTNNARKNIAVNKIAIDSKNCLFNTSYYTLSDNNLQAYLYLLSLQFTNNKQFEGIFEVSGIYTMSKMQLLWVASQFWRSAYQVIEGEDPFDTLLKSNDVKNAYGSSYDIFKKSFEMLKNESTNYLFDLSQYNGDFVNQMVQYYVNWVENEYVTSLESTVYQYCQLSENGINPTSADYPNYKKYYNEVLLSLIDFIDVLVVNPLKVVVPKSTLAVSLGLNEITSTELSTYLLRWIETFKKIVRISNGDGIKTTPTSISKSNGESDYYLKDKDFKLSTYKHFKNLYDKWIGGNINSQVHNTCQCGVNPNRTSKLIDRFHFIDRTWSYIGKKAMINPKTFMILSKEVDINLYSLIGSIVRDSNFDFHVLPTWVNYKKISDVQDMWKPHTDLKDASVGAAYVCMYMGGTSKVLDIGKKSYYINDGFDLRSSDRANIPDGFKNRVLPDNISSLEENEKYKYNMAAFRVGFADQNQSIFTKISDLSQKENRESGESLQALSDAFDGKGGTKRMYKGVNLYNVYAIRSYKCTVSCLGNMMIHPLTYFQLDNIPFFHGAYLITNVKHSIEPHFIETTFSGRRVPRYTVPIVDKATTFVQIPLTDTLFKPEDLNKSIVRPLHSFDEDDGDVISDGDDTFNRAISRYSPSQNEFLRGREADNSLLDVVFNNKKFSFWIQDDVTPETLDSKIKSVYNPNNPIKFTDVGMGQCYKWVKQSLREIGVLQDAFSGIDAWTMMAGWNDTEFQYVSEEDFVKNLGGWTNESMKEAGIPDGSFIACYYAQSGSMERAIDVVSNCGVSQAKLYKLKRFRDLDPKTKNRTFSYNTYLKKNSKNQWINPPADGSIIPFVPATHAALFINGHCFHQLAYVWNRPSTTMRIIGYYPFKDKLYQKVGGNSNDSANTSGFFGTVSNFFGF